MRHLHSVLEAEASRQTLALRADRFGHDADELSFGKVLCAGAWQTTA
jgi:hypothetical protein